MVASSKGPEQGNQSQHQLGGQRTPRIVQGIPIVPGPPHLEQCAHAIPVRVLTPLFPVRTQPFLLRC